MERSCVPMDKNRIEGGAEQGERAMFRKAFVVKVLSAILIAGMASVFSALVPQSERKGKFMKKAKPKDDEMRAEYRREDLGPLVRGKYAAQYVKATNIVVIDPVLTKVFPNSEAVNDALRSLVSIASKATGITNRPSRTSRKRAVS